MRPWIIVPGGLAAGVLLLLLLLQHGSPEPQPDAIGRRGHAVPAVPVEGVSANEPAGRRSERVDREAAALASPSTALSAEWTVRLLGIDPAVPWTAPLQLVFQERLDVRGRVDAEGVFRFVPPAGARLPGITVVRLVAEDPHYRVEPATHETFGLQDRGQQDFTVYPIARLRGRVLGPDGAGLAARVRAFAWDAGGPREPLLASTTAAADGSYQLRVPPATPVLVLADAVHEEVATLLPRGPRPVFLHHLMARSADELLPDHREARRDLLPAALRAEGAAHAERTVADLRLARPAQLTGRVTFADGRPWPAVRVHATPAAARPPWLAQLHWSPDEGLVAGATATTDSGGHFALPLAPGVAFRVAVDPAPAGPASAPPPVVATAPDDIAIVAAGTPLLVRALVDGAAARDVHFDVADTSVPAPAGELTLVLGPVPVRLRARTVERASPWQTVPSTDRPGELALDLAPIALADVAIQLRGSPTPTEVVFVWQALPAGPPLHHAVERRPGDEPFRLRVPPGRYRLTVRGRDGTPGGDYLLPQQFDVDVPPAGFTGNYDVAFGSRLELDARDANGLRAGGTFRLLDASRHDVTPSTMVWRDGGTPHRGAIGELLPHNLNHVETVLPPGDYTLTVQSGTRSAQQTIQLRRGVTTRASVPLR